MKLNSNILLILSVFWLLGCGGENSSKQSEIEIENKELPAEERAEQALYKELMKVHDDAMPKMDNMMQLKGSLRQQLDIMRESEEVDSSKIKQLEDAINRLESASEGMMQWMRDFKPLDTGSKTHEEKMEYYKEKKASINKVSEEIDQALKQAKKLKKEE